MKCNMTVTVELVKKLVSILPRGRDNRIPQVMLALRMGLSERWTRRLIEVAIAKYSDVILAETGGLMICTSCGEYSGYWLSDDPADIALSAAEVRSRMGASSRRLQVYEDYLETIKDGDHCHDPR